VVTDSDPDQDPAVPTPEYLESRVALDAQARAWASTARRWLWVVSLAALAMVAVGVGVVVF
jgi:hypothetical protein